MGNEAKYRAIATIAIGPLSSTALVPSVWLSITMRCALWPAIVARIDGVTTRFTRARTTIRAVGCMPAAIASVIRWPSSAPRKAPGTSHCVPS